MKIFVEDIDERTVSEELASLLPLLPAWRRQQAMNYFFPIDRLQCAKVYMLLCKALRQEYGVGEMPGFGYGANGKPFLADFPDMHFNMSHCRKAVMCVVAGRPVGCDIEVIPDVVPEEVLQLAFNEQERLDVANAESPSTEFTQLWTRKEALLKLSGEGLTDDMPDVLNVQKSGKCSLVTDTVADKGYSYTVCIGY